MEEIKTTSETIIVSGAETWENLGETSVYADRAYTGFGPCGTATVLYKQVPGLGHRYKVLYKDNIWIPKFVTHTGGLNARISSKEYPCYLYIEGFGQA
jgi:hypothetical protein